MRLFNLTRGQKTARNLLLTLVLAVSWYLLAGCPALTKGQLLRRAARQCLLPDAQLVYEDRTALDNQQMYLQSGRRFLRLPYDHTLRYYTFDGAWDLYDTADGVLVYPSSEREGVLLALGEDLQDAASASITAWISADPEDQTWTFSAEGVRENDTAFSFVLDESYHAATASKEEQALHETLLVNVFPQNYYHYTLTLYGGDGALLRTLTG